MSRPRQTFALPRFGHCKPWKQPWQRVIARWTALNLGGGQPSKHPSEFSHHWLLTTVHGALSTIHKSLIPGQTTSVTTTAASTAVDRGCGYWVLAAGTLR